MKSDPVCGMQVEPDRAQSKADYHGQTYYFCSRDCKQKFDQNPAQFAR
jgi:Cu+-exporting ATPase